MTSSTPFLIKNIYSDGSSNPSNFSVVGSHLYFLASDEAGDYPDTKAWRTDGTTEGTELIYDGDVDGKTDFPSINGNETFFSSSDGRLHKATSDQVSTTQITGSGDPFPYGDYCVATSNTFYFKTEADGGLYELWKVGSGETEAEEVLSGGNSITGSGNFAALDDSIFFTATDGDSSNTLFYRSTDTTPVSFEGDTRRAMELAVVGTTLYFVERDDAQNYPLWKINGEDPNTTSTQEELGLEGVNNLTAVGDKLFFVATDPSTSDGGELFSSDGTPDNTNIVKDITVGTGNSNLANLTAVGDKLFFEYRDDFGYGQLWVSDGTESETYLLKEDFNDELRNFTVVGDYLFFIGSTADHGSELWVSDGTEDGTSMVLDFNPGAADGVIVSNVSDVRTLAALGNTLLFRGNNGNDDIELWGLSLIHI